MGKECKSLWEREYTVEEYKKYRINILEDLYIRLNEEQQKHLNSLDTHADVDAYLNDVIINSKQNSGPTPKEIADKAYNKMVVNKRRTQRNAAKRKANEASRG